MEKVLEMWIWIWISVHKNDSGHSSTEASFPRGGGDPSDCIVGMSLACMREIIFARHTRGYLQDDILSPHIIIQHQYNVCVALIADY